jgi:hypothetical protein
MKHFSLKKQQSFLLVQESGERVGGLVRKQNVNSANVY